MPLACSQQNSLFTNGSYNRLGFFLRDHLTKNGERSKRPGGDLVDIAEEQLHYDPHLMGRRGCAEAVFRPVDHRDTLLSHG